MALKQFSLGVRSSLLFLMLLGASFSAGCGSDENEINIPENPLPIPGPEARLSHGSGDAAVGSEQSQTAQ